MITSIIAYDEAYRYSMTYCKRLQKHVMVRGAVSFTAAWASIYFIATIFQATGVNILSGDTLSITFLIPVVCPLLFVCDFKNHVHRTRLDQPFCCTMWHINLSQTSSRTCSIKSYSMEGSDQIVDYVIGRVEFLLHSLCLRKKASFHPVLQAAKARMLLFRASMFAGKLFVSNNLNVKPTLQQERFDEATRSWHCCSFLLFKYGIGLVKVNSSLAILTARLVKSSGLNKAWAPNHPISLAETTCNFVVDGKPACQVVGEILPAKVVVIFSMKTTPRVWLLSRCDRDLRTPASIPAQPRLTIRNSDSTVSVASGSGPWRSAEIKAKYSTPFS